MATTTKVSAPELNVPVVTMRRIAEKEKQLIEDDALVGITQSSTGSRTSSYKSEPYKKYKQNRMQRFTDRTGAKGTNIKAYSGQSVRYSQTGIKNYHLTGRMYDDMLTRAKINECIVFVAHKDRGKVLGAMDAGDRLMSLNNKNVDIIEKMILKKYDKELKKWGKKGLVLTIG